MKTYPISNNLSYEEQQKFGTKGNFLPSIEMYPKGVMAIRTGEYRAPKAGEWYLSGAKPSAWKAPNDFIDNMKFHIMRLVKVETVVTEKIVLV